MAAMRAGVVAMVMGVAVASAWAGEGEPAAAQLLSSPKGQARASFDAGAVTVERRVGQGWQLAWRGALPRAVVAGGAMLGDDGALLVFDQVSPQGEHAIALRDAQGRLVRELDLGEFLPAAYIHALPRGADGLHWRSAAEMAGGLAEFSVPAPGEGGGALRFSIDLRDGSVRTAQIREYLAAADAARALEASTATGIARAAP
jgi:hypothetical protein